ncbi:TIGR01841 family phasin [Paraburkholderia sp. MMS20-SJTN17]|uniref:TIGR01841 family phasin n=1 Tax=Paraburkholderia translucens TaxID=2886945 RepID=A0ABS8KIH0_9BURK|nr:TIGR01841 family phasin [Paraburkholderia sp. MMS20-SJTN17]MCC8404559.1 TIGR01841 family phasin [Paraburkholderia sp. MMS20-SJTN17]
MNSITPEQIVAVQKASIDTTFEILSKSVNAIEKLTALTLQAAKTGLAEKQDALLKAFEAGAPHTFVAQQAGQAQPAIEKIQSYWRQVYEIASSTRAELLAIGETQLKKYQQDAQRYAENLAKTAPAGSETAVTAWKTFITTLIETANTAYDTATKAVKQAGASVENDISAPAPSTTKRVRQLAAPVETSDE